MSPLKEAYEEAKRKAKQASMAWAKADGEEASASRIKELEKAYYEAEALQKAAFKAYMESDES